MGKQSKKVGKHQSMPRKSKNMTATSKCAHELSLSRQPHSIISGFLENNYLNLENLWYVDNYEPCYVIEKPTRNSDLTFWRRNYFLKF